MFRNPTVLCALALSASLPLSADFSYSKTQKVSGGSMAAMAGAGLESAGKAWFKGEKSADVRGDITTIIDFAAKTITTVNKAQKTYKVVKFSDLSGPGVNADVSMDVKETGQTKTINGFNAKEAIVTVNMELETGRGPAMKMQAEIEVWRSTEVPGAAEMRAFYQKNGANFPYAALIGTGGNQSMQRAIAQVQKKLSESDGMVVEEVVRVRPAGGAAQTQMPQMPQMTPEQQAKMQAAMAQMQAMSQQGGPQAEAMKKAMAAMGRGAAAPASAGSSPALIEITIDNTGFSTAAVSDSEFVVPSDYRRVE